MMRDYFSRKRVLYHYVSMAEGNFRGYLRGDMVRAKKYFYVLRPVLACRWVLERGTPPPMLFSELAASELPESLRPTVERLLHIKMHAPEIQTIPREPELQAYLEQSIEEIKGLLPAMEEAKNPGWAGLNAMFMQALK